MTAEIRVLSTTSLNSDLLSEIVSGKPCVESTCDYFIKG